MVKIFLVIALFFSFSAAAEIKNKETHISKSENLLTAKIKSFIGEAAFKKDRAYIDIIFSPKEDYYINDGRVDSVKVIQTLKENGILNLFFKEPCEINISFKTDGPPLFFVKIMSDSLQNIGYYRYVTKESNLKASEFTWQISLTSEYAADPLILSQELSKSGCEIVDIIRESETDWTYVVNMQKAKLDTKVLEDGEELELKRSLYSYWLDVSKIKKLRISSSHRNSWYPYIAYYDKSLNLLRVLKKDVKRRRITLDMKENTYYIKISDIYTLKNIKDALMLTSIGVREAFPKQ
ncbi:hypothetical protein HUE87_11365 [Candidatus Sulfurimonas marisnigri]|uniref:Periplasmic protein n=1 Tax=Candidatus Sulfurimonas marisnigri TaxID=2740405 RepID=A0A7S7LZR5_9BACT|nr:hypothetical protein [Candidatus Sulfurimonas marisnigri]QOY54460.1 hypothetical protein HUE87_11365 [Candidatus Sulfurimonas marisnigri]